MEGGEGVVGVVKRKQHGFNGVLLISVGTRASKAMEGTAEGEKDKYLPTSQTGTGRWQPKWQAVRLSRVWDRPYRSCRVKGHHTAISGLCPMTAGTETRKRLRGRCRCHQSADRGERGMSAACDLQGHHRCVQHPAPKGIRGERKDAFPLPAVVGFARLARRAEPSWTEKAPSEGGPVRSTFVFGRAICPQRGTLSSPLQSKITTQGIQRME